MNRTVLRLGFVPLTDAAPLVVAHEMGFAAEEGLALELSPAPSWSTLRDLLDHGDVVAAHMLAPVPVSRALGLGPAGPPLEALSLLSLNGTVVGIARALAERLQDAAPLPDFGDALGWRARLAWAGPIRLGVPFAFSMHRELMHRWLDGAVDLQIRTVPPSMMTDALAAGEIDAFCVGEPWGSEAVEAGLAQLILPGRAIWASAPEKALVAQTGWADAMPGPAAALLRALWRAGHWLADPAQRGTAVELLARKSYLGRSSDILERAMTGNLVTTPEGAMRHVPDFVDFHDGAATFPWRSQAAWIGDRLAARFDLDPATSRKTAMGVFRSDLYRAALAGSGASLPSASVRVEGALHAPTAVPAVEGRLILSPDAFFDGIPFDPAA